MGHVVGRPEALQRMDLAKLFLDGLGYLLLVALGQDRLGGEAVGSDAIRARLGGQLLGEHLDARFGSGVGQWGLGVGRRAAAEDIVMMTP